MKIGFKKNLVDKPNDQISTRVLYVSNNLCNSDVSVLFFYLLCNRKSFSKLILFPFPVVIHD